MFRHFDQPVISNTHTHINSDHVAHNWKHFSAASICKWNVKGLTEGADPLSYHVRVVTELTAKLTTRNATVEFCGKTLKL
jgi:hypothetical protein